MNEKVEKSILKLLVRGFEQHLDEIYNYVRDRSDNNKVDTHFKKSMIIRYGIENLSSNPNFMDLIRKLMHDTNIYTEAKDDNISPADRIVKQEQPYNIELFNLFLSKITSEKQHLKYEDKYIKRITIFAVSYTHLTLPTSPKV